jgi:hypothetical protein
MMLRSADDDADAAAATAAIAIAPPAKRTAPAIYTAREQTVSKTNKQLINNRSTPAINSKLRVRRHREEQAGKNQQCDEESEDEAEPIAVGAEQRKELAVATYTQYMSRLCPLSSTPASVRTIPNRRT